MMVNFYDFERFYTLKLALFACYIDRFFSANKTFVLDIRRLDTFCDF